MVFFMYFSIKLRELIFLNKMMFMPFKFNIFDFFKSIMEFRIKKIQFPSNLTEKIDGECHVLSMDSI